MFGRARVRAAAIVGAVVTITALGVGLRVFLLQRSLWMVGGDEVIVGLAAKHILEGERPIFFYGQPYMGLLQSYLAAPLYAFFGVSAVALKTVPLAFSALFIVTIYLLGRDLFNQRVGLLAAVFTAIPPLYISVGGLKAWGPYIEVMALGNILLLLGWRIPKRGKGPAPWLLWGLAGLVAGIAFWSNGLVIYYVVTFFLILFLKDGRFFWQRPFALFVLAFFLGSLPLWLYNLEHNLATFRFLLRANVATNPLNAQNAGAIMKVFFKDLVTWVTGIWEPWTHNLTLLSGAMLGLNLAAFSYLFLSRAYRSLKGEGRRLLGEHVLLIFCLSVPAIYLLSGFGGPSLNPYGVDATGRYLLPLYTAVPLVWAWFIDRVAGWGRGWLWPLALALGLLVIGSNLYGTVRSDPGLVFQSPYMAPVPPSHQPLIDFLRKEGIKYIWMNKWVGYPVMFATEEEIISTDCFRFMVADDIDRFPAHTQEIKAAPNAAWVLLASPGEITPFEKRLQELGVSYRKEEIPPTYVVYLPSRRLDCSEVGDTLDWRY